MLMYGVKFIFLLFYHNLYFYPFNWSVTVQCLCLDFEVCNGESGWSVMKESWWRGGLGCKAELGSIDWWCDWRPPLLWGSGHLSLTTCTAKCVCKKVKWCRMSGEKTNSVPFIYTDICLGEYAIAKEFLCVGDISRLRHSGTFTPRASTCPGC